MKSCFAALLTTFAAGAFAQDDAPVFRATSDLVMLDVQVIHNKTNVAAGDLTARDFDLSEDGVPQKIRFFGRDQLPLSIVLLFDLTQSVQGVLHRLAEGAHSALHHLKPEDEVAVMVYAASATLVDGFTRDRSQTAAAIARAARMNSGDAAFFNEAIYQAAAQLEKSASPSSRRVILWLTDNLPNVPSGENIRDNAKGLKGAAPHSEEDAIREMHESGTVVMPLLLKDLFWRFAAAIFVRENAERRDHPPGDANKYAELSGSFAVPMRGKGVEERLAEVIDSLRGRYAIGYRPAEDKPAGTFCRVQVALSAEAPLRAKEWHVLTRAGYYRR